MTPYVVVLITAPNEEAGAKIARALVEEALAACVNIVRGVRSIYRWQGKVEDETEVLLIIKTRAAMFEALKERARQLHPYDVPEIIALPIEQGLGEYLSWVGDSTGA